MRDRPLVSAVCATWQRHDEVRGLWASLLAQTYRPLELSIVSDGPDPALATLLQDLVLDQVEATPSGKRIPDERLVSLVFAPLGFQTTEYLAMSPAACPFLVAQLMARGELQMWASDDERFTPDHVETLVEAILGQDVDFAYSQAGCWLKGNPDDVTVIGSDPPTSGHITHAMYRRTLLDYRSFATGVGSGTDWDQIRHWVAAGASWAYVPRVTMTHRVDKYGEGPCCRLYRQPLRGLGGGGTYAGPVWHGRFPVDPNTARLRPLYGVNP